jgi:hypothetical protein
MAACLFHLTKKHQYFVAPYIEQLQLSEVNPCTHACDSCALIQEKEEEAMVDAIVNIDSEASDQVRIGALDWLCSQHYTEVELLVSIFIR